MTAIETLNEFLREVELERYDTGFDYVNPEVSASIREVLVEIRRLRTKIDEALEIPEGTSVRSAEIIEEMVKALKGDKND